MSETPPDILIFCFYAEKIEQLQYIKELNNFSRRLPVLVLTGCKKQWVRLEALRSGASNVIYENQSPQKLLSAIKKLNRGEKLIDQKIVSEEERTDKKETDLNSLSRRETEVIQALCDGLSNKEIGNVLCISEATVRHHLSSIYSKLYLDDRLNLVIYALKNGIADNGASKSNESPP